MPARQIVDLSLHVHMRTDKAVLVSDDGIRSHAVWLPLSQVEIENDDEELSGVYTIAVPRWLAIDKNLV